MLIPTSPRRPNPTRLIWLFTALLGLVLAACGAGDSSEEAGTPTPPPDATTLAQAFDGDESEHDSVFVKQLQAELDHLGYHAGHVDGIWGERTSTALAAFQAENGIEATGHYDAATAAALTEAASDAAALSIESLQQKLAELGFYSGTIDGDYGDGTEAAVRAYQAANGLPESGVIDHETFLSVSEVHATTVEQAHLDAARANGIGGVENVKLGNSVVPDDYLKQGSEGPEVQELQERLAELGYRPGAANGSFGAETASAVLAFQKAEGLQRDSIVGPEVEARLANPQAAGPRSSAPGPRVEVDLDRQILFAIDAAGKVTTINVSTGSGREYQSAEEGKGIVVAHTPIGEFVVQRSIDGLRKAPLGTLYRPLYFDGGWAIHGNPHVPAYPASHGCVRTANWDQDFVWTVIQDGDPVSIYGHNPDLPGNAASGA